MRRRTSRSGSSSSPDPAPPGGGELDVDFTVEEPPPPNTLVELGSKKWTPERGREYVRGALAVSLVGIVAVLGGFSYWALADGLLSIDELQALNPIFASLSTLAGTAIGFYFGGRSN